MRREEVPRSSSGKARGDSRQSGWSDSQVDSQVDGRQPTTVDDDRHKAGDSYLRWTVLGAGKRPASYLQTPALPLGYVAVRASGEPRVPLPPRRGHGLVGWCGGGRWAAARRPPTRAGGSGQLVPRMRLELIRPYGHRPLKTACLPIPPPRRVLAGGSGGTRVPDLRCSGASRDAHHHACPARTRLSSGFARPESTSPRRARRARTARRDRPGWSM